MNLNIKGKVFNLPLDISTYYDQDVNCTYWLLDNANVKTL